MNIKQKTIKERVEFSGKGLQTGNLAHVVCLPAPPETGIIFTRVDLPEKPRFVVTPEAHKEGPLRRSAIGDAATTIQTVEHLLAALWGAGIDNIFIEIDNDEIPAMGGSAIEFLMGFNQTGIVEQDAPRKIIKVDRPILIKGDNDSAIGIVPGDTFKITYIIDYDCPSIGTEKFTIELNKKMFERYIAPARTFCLKREAEALLKAGLGKGADYENTLVMDEDGPVGTQLRFPNEPVRHKVLDLVGDLYLLGCPVVGEITARKSGHTLNAELVKQLWEKYRARGTMA